jgi:hypothetical protein
VAVDWGRQQELDVIAIIIRLIEECVTRSDPRDAKARLPKGMSELAVYSDIVNCVGSSKYADMYFSVHSRRPNEPTEFYKQIVIVLAKPGQK